MNKIVNPRFAPARVPDKNKLLKVLKSFSIKDGTGAEHGEMPTDNQVCIMEATAYILGYEIINDAPTCTSAVIRELMIDINDNIDSSRQRNKLKALIPDIINTAPTYWSRNTVIPELRTLNSDPNYKKAEKVRKEMIDQQRFSKNVKTGFGHSYIDTRTGSEAITGWSMPKIIAFIRELADVAKFDTAPVVEQKES